MNFEQIEAAEAIEKATTGQQAFMLIPIHPGTTLQEMDEAVGYVAPILTSGSASGHGEDESR